MGSHSGSNPASPRSPRARAGGVYQAIPPRAGAGGDSAAGAFTRAPPLRAIPVRLRPMPTIGSPLLTFAAETPMMLDLLIVLAVAAVVAVAMQRLRLAVIPAYLITGAIVGPNAAGLLRTDSSLDAISNLAIILLLFGIGLQLHLPARRRDALPTLLVGVAAVALCVLLGWPVAAIFGLSPPAALAVAMALSLSSTAVVLRIIVERRELHHTSGRLAFAILIIQDLAVPLMLVALPALARWEGVAPPEEQADLSLARVLLNGAARFGGVLGLVLVGRWVLPRLLHEAARGRSGEVMLIISIAAAMGMAAATYALGFSHELGAFLAGFTLSATPFRHQLSGQIGPARDLFVAVFFTTVGMALDPRALAEYWWLILIAGAVMSAIKTIAIGGAAWALGASAPVAVVVGLSLAQAGEFSLVLLESAGDQNLLSADAIAITVAIVVVSLIITPAMIWASRRVAPRMAWLRTAPWMQSSSLSREAREVALPSEAPGGGERALRVIIGGYGPVGRAVADRLQAGGAEIVIVEMNPATVRTQTELGRSIVFGDISTEEVLEHAGVSSADALVLTIPDDQAVLRACQTARRLAPDIFIAARTDYMGRGLLAHSLGANHVTVEELVTAEAMQKAVVEEISKRRGRMTEPAR